jgi:hypothetical protein
MPKLLKKIIKAKLEESNIKRPWGSGYVRGWKNSLKDCYQAVRSEACSTIVISTIILSYFN